MLRDRTWHTTNTLTRAQWSLVQALGDAINLPEDDRRRILNLTRHEWLTWTNFLTDGPQPAEPALSDMLRRLGAFAFSLSLLAGNCSTHPSLCKRLINKAY